MKIALIVSRFNEKTTSSMEKAAENKAKKLGIGVVKKIHVPGAFELPFALKNILEKEKVDGAVLIGAVIKGRTDHDKLIMNTITPKILELSLKHNKPVGMGIMGPNISSKEAKDTAEEYAERAVETAYGMLNI